jgi:hypothetical protein
MCIFREPTLIEKIDKPTYRIATRANRKPLIICRRRKIVEGTNFCQAF